MATSSLELIARLVAGYPETTPASHLGTPDFRVRGKIFVTASLDGAWAVLKLPMMVQASLLQSQADAFSAEPGWGRFGWTRCRIDKIDAALLKDLIDVAWRQVAPKTLAAAREASV